VVYKAFGDTLRMDFVRAFLELWLRMISLELWLGVEVKHVELLELWLGMEDEQWTFIELWLEMVCVTGVSVRVVTRT